MTTENRSVERLSQRLEQVFSTIQRERMHDVPVLNDRIDVQAVGFREHEERWLGVMITPWFMNLMLLPGEGDDWSGQVELSEHSHPFPSGNYRFIAGSEPAIGPYRSCSLFSPMFEFADHRAAVETAESVMAELMNEQNRDEGDISQSQVKAIWNGDAEAPEDQDGTDAGVSLKTEDSEPRPSLSERAKEPMSRRDLLRGAFLRDGNEQ